MVQIFCTVFIFGVSTFLPNALRVMRYVGTAYILWLTIHIVINKSADDDSEKSASFIKGFLLQFVSVKIYLFGTTALTGYITDYSTSFSVLLVTELTVATIGAIATLIWIGLETLPRTVYRKYYRPTGIVLAFTLFEYTYSMLKRQTIKKSGGDPVRDETKCLHAGYSPKNAEPRVVPVVQNTAYVYDSAEEVVAMFDDPTKSLIYLRFGSPTVMVVEDKIVQLEGGIGTMCTASRQAATPFSVLNICNVGDSSISTTEIYGSSANLFSFTLEKLDIECIYIDKNVSDEEIDKVFQSNTKVMFGETIVSPAPTVFDVERFIRIVHRHNIPLVVDNTFAMPILCELFKCGADIVIHLTSKYIDNHMVQIGGCIIDSGNLDWTKGNFPNLTGPDESYYGVSCTETYGKKAYIVKARMQLMRSFGVYSVAHSAFLLNLGLETPIVRMKQYYESTMTVVRYLERSPYVERVIYPEFEDDENHPLVQKYLKGCSDVTSFIIKGEEETTMRFMNVLEFASNEVHVAGIRVRVLHPTSETHRQLTDEQLIAAGIENDMIRLSIRFESTENTITDLDKAFLVIEY